MHIGASHWRSGPKASEAVVSHEDGTAIVTLSADVSDVLLVERAVAGDQKAFEMLVIKYQRRIERLVSRMVRDHELVQDIAQETFIRAYRALPQFRGESAFYTWLYRIAVNTAKKALVDLKRDPVINESALLSSGRNCRRCWPDRKSVV